MIDFLTNGSAIVADLSPQTAKELYLMRISLETLLMKHAVPHIEPIHLIKAENALRLIDHESDAYQWMRLNWDFHTALYSPAEMPTILDTVQNCTSTRFAISSPPIDPIIETLRRRSIASFYRLVSLAMSMAHAAHCIPISLNL